MRAVLRGAASNGRLFRRPADASYMAPLLSRSTFCSQPTSDSSPDLIKFPTDAVSTWHFHNAVGVGMFRRMRVTMETIAVKSAILPSFDAESYVDGSKAV